MIWFYMSIQEKCVFGLVCVCVCVCVCVLGVGEHILVCCACAYLRTCLRERGRSVSMVFDRSWTFIPRSILIYRNIDVLQIDPLMLLTVN